MLVAEERDAENELLPVRARLEVYLAELLRFWASYFIPKLRVLLCGATRPMVRLVLRPVPI